MSISNKITIIVIKLALLSQSVSGNEEFSFDHFNPFKHLLSFGKLESGEQMHPFDYFLLDIVPRIFNQAPNNENGTRAAEYEHYALTDESNDDAVKLTGQELILRSGFNYEVYDAIADDGYITELTRMINPLADRTKLRYPPVILEHGGTIDPSAYLIASSIQHFPEKWPRTHSDGPIKSSNRSLAFVLANNGFDVWLAETRGSSDRNRRRVKEAALKSTLEGRNIDKNMTFAEQIHQIMNSWNYWAFSQDDIIAHELKSHMDTVLNITGAKKLSILTFSLSTPTSFAFFSTRPEYAEKVNGFVSMAPIVSGEGVNHLIKIALETLCPILPDHLGTLMFTDFMFTQPMRDLIVFVSKNRQARYSLVKMVISLLMGPSAKYQTLLDLNVLGHMLRELSFKEAKQLCQQMSSNRLQKYDYGPLKNLWLYKSLKPPVYDISDLAIKNWILVTAYGDSLSTPKVIDHLLRIVNPKPVAHFCVPHFNHLDLIAAHENDKYVNIPILKYFTKMSYDQSEEFHGSSSARSLDLSHLFPQIDFLNPQNEASKSDYNKSSKSGERSSSLDANKMMDTFKRSIETVFSGIGNLNSISVQNASGISEMFPFKLPKLDSFLPLLNGADSNSEKSSNYAS